MRSKITALALFVFTALAVAYYPVLRGAGATTSTGVDPVTVRPPVDPLTNERPNVEVAFVLDTTGSMSGLIQAAKEKIWSVASTMASAQPAPEIRMGLVAYRDRGDDYVTRVVDLSEDLDSMYATLMDLQAGGGGDGPESVNQALHDAVNGMSWSQDPRVYRVVFLVGDAPPHMDYQDDVKYPQTIALAADKGIVVNAIQCGHNGATTREWNRIASLGQGEYFRVEQSGGAVAISTPFDEKLADLSVRLDRTRIYYGSDEDRKRQERKAEATDKLYSLSSVAALARRAAFNVSKSGLGNLLGEKELVDDVLSGRVDLSTADPETMPQALTVMPPEEQEAFIREKAEERESLKQEIQELARQRDAYLRKEVAERGGAKDSLDHKIYSAVRAQAAPKGLTYEADAPAY
jgi:Mg-chelatase subunit ChlD